MKRAFVFLVVIATACSALLSHEDIAPLVEAVPANVIELQSVGKASSLAGDGYRYKTVKGLGLRQRRDISALYIDKYLPPIQSVPAVADIPVFVNAPARTEQGSVVIDNDGYHYKTIKRIRYRYRRGVNELPYNEHWILRRSRPKLVTTRKMQRSPKACLNKQHNK